MNGRERDWIEWERKRLDWIEWEGKGLDWIEWEEMGLDLDGKGKRKRVWRETKDKRGHGMWDRGRNGEGCKEGEKRVGEGIGRVGEGI